MIDPVPRANLPQVIAERIIDLITRGELKLGERLPPQRQLAKDLGVGVSSLRESLQSLSAIGLIQIQPGRGTFVSDSLDGLVGRQVGSAALTTSRDLHDLLEARMYLDSTVVALACRRATETDLATILGHYEKMRRAVGDQDMAALEVADLAFHLAIADAAHNHVLAHLIHSVTSLIKHQIHATPYSQTILDQHLAILTAIEAHDVSAARTAALQVIRASAKELDLHDFENEDYVTTPQVTRSTHTKEENEMRPAPEPTTARHSEKRS